MDRCDIPGMVSALPARAEPGQFKERPVRAWANGFETLHPPEVVEGRESKVEKGDTARMCATTCTKFGGKNLHATQRSSPCRMSRAAAGMP